MRVPEYSEFRSVYRLSNGNIMATKAADEDRAIAAAGYAAGSEYVVPVGLEIERVWIEKREVIEGVPQEWVPYGRV